MNPETRKCVVYSICKSKMAWHGSSAWSASVGLEGESLTAKQEIYCYSSFLSEEI